MKGHSREASVSGAIGSSGPLRPVNGSVIHEGVIAVSDEPASR